MNISPTHPAMLGIQRGMQGMQKAADDVVSAKGEYAQLTEAMVSLKTQANFVEASARVIKTSDDMLGSLLDVIA